MIRISRCMLFCAGFVVLAPALLTAQSFLPLYRGESGTLVQDYMFGGDIDDQDDFFFRTADIAIDSRGNLFVLDSKAFCVKKFAPDGSHLATFGGKGEGPGEMIGAYRMAIDPDDNIMIYDPMNSKRFSLFDNQGVFLKAVSLTEFGYRNITDFDIGPNGDLYVRLFTPDFTKPNSKSLISIAKLDLATRRIQTIDSVSVLVTYARSDGETMQMATAPYYSDLLWAVSPAGNLITADSDTYRIRIYSPDLKLLHEHQHDGTVRPITDEDKEDYFDSFEENTVQWLRKTAEFPERKPYFDWLCVDHEGYILLNIDDVDDTTRLFDVLDPEGRRIGTVQLPHLRSTAIFTDGAVYTTGSYQEEDFVVYRYRLE